MIIPSHDMFFMPYSENIKSLSGFTGSTSMALVTKDHSFFFTDGRYLLQASQEIDSSLFTLLPWEERFTGDWSNAIAGKPIGFDPNLHSRPWLDQFADSTNAILHSVEDVIPYARESKSKIYELPLAYSGKHRDQKVLEVLSLLDKKADYLLITKPENICWLLNIRASDVPNIPILLCFALLHKNGAIEIFTNNSDPSFKLEKVLIHPLSSIYQRLPSLNNVQVDLNAPAKLFDLLADPTVDNDPIATLKAIKNSSEIDGFKKAHSIDATALSKFFTWLKAQPSNSISEYEAALKLCAFRSLDPAFLCESFDTISAYGKNAAIVHYRAHKGTDTLVGNDNLYLLDSGAHYLFGTTDVTRTIHLGTPSRKQIQLFTAVLKGHIAIATARFPEGVTGSELDALARRCLWDLDMDYPHSTGHGVGHCLSVHEYPGRIGRYIPNDLPLKAGMVLSNEPGVYIDGECGIRIENLMLVVQDGDFLKFDILTYVPIQESLVDIHMLTTKELEWLKAYNAFCVASS